MTVDTAEAAVPNHHAHHPPFAGISGALAALGMAAGSHDDARWAAELAGVRPGDAVVDVGSGPGSAARHAASLGAEVVGVEPAAVMRRTARVLTLGRARVRYVAGTAESLPLDDDSASVLWSLSAVHHWDDVDAGLREARRVLRDGGRLVAVERRSMPGATGLAGHGWTDAQAAAFAEACAAHGFTGARVEHRAGRRRGHGLVAVVATAA